MRVLRLFKLLVDDRIIPARIVIDLMDKNQIVREYFDHPVYWQDLLSRDWKKVRKYKNPLSEYAYRATTRKYPKYVLHSKNPENEIYIYASEYVALPRAYIDIYERSPNLIHEHEHVKLQHFSAELTKYTTWLYENNMFIAINLDKSLIYIWNIPTCIKNTLKLTLKLSLDARKVKYSITPDHVNIIKNELPWTIDIYNQEDPLNPVWTAVSLKNMPKQYILSSCEIYKHGFLLRMKKYKNGNDILYECDIDGNIRPRGQSTGFANYKQNLTFDDSVDIIDNDYGEILLPELSLYEYEDVFDEYVSNQMEPIDYEWEYSITAAPGNPYEACRV